MKLAPRDNVYLEFALYGGILSVPRSFFMMDEKCKAASDLNGVTLFYYNDQEDSIERCCEQLKEYIREEERENQPDPSASIYKPGDRLLSEFY